MHKIEKQQLFFSKCKMIKISADTFAKNCVYSIIDKEKMLWLRNKEIIDLIDKDIKGKLKTNNPTKQQIKEYK